MTIEEEHIGDRFPQEVSIAKQDVTLHLGDIYLRGDLHEETGVVVNCVDDLAPHPPGGDPAPNSDLVWDDVLASRIKRQARPKPPKDVDAIREIVDAVEDAMDMGMPDEYVPPPSVDGLGEMSMIVKYRTRVLKPRPNATKLVPNQSFPSQ